MAIPKLSTKKNEYSPQALAFLGTSAGLALLSLLLLYLSLGRFMLNRNLRAGLVAEASGRPGEAGAAYESAVGWKPSNPWARLLLARHNYNVGRLELAETHYKALLDGGAVEVTEDAATGLGMIALRRADKESDPKKRAAALDEARRNFRAAGGNPSAEIGLRHADLLDAVKSGDQPRVEALRGEFVKLLQKYAKGNPTVLPEGLVDLYAGLGVTHYRPGEDSPEAAAYFASCFQSAPKWALPLINSVRLEAARLGSQPFTQEDWMALRPTVDRNINEWRDLWNGTNQQYKPLKEAWFQYLIAALYRGALSAPIDGWFTNLHDQLTNNPTWKAQPATWSVVAAVWMEYSKRLTQADQKNNAIQRAGSEIDKVRRQEDIFLRDEPAYHRLRAGLLHVRATAYEQQGAWHANPQAYGEAVKLWQEAIKVEKEKLGSAEGSYEAHRNLAVVLKRIKSDQAQVHYDTAVRIAEAGDPVGQADVAELKKFWGAP